MEEDYEGIIRYIAAKQGARVTSDEIRDYFGIRETTTGNYNSRRAIKEAMRRHGADLGLPIGADGKGYFLITMEEEINDYVDNLTARILGIKERIRLMIQAWGARGRTGE